MIKRIFLVLSLLLVLSASALAADYVVGCGDRLQISVWGSPDLSAEVSVRPDGYITLPAIGDVKAQGFTISVLKTRLESKIAKLIKKPIVTLTVTEITNNKIFISGGGVSTGVVQIAGETTLFRLLCQLGNLEGADLDNAYLYRSGHKLLTGFYNLFMLGKMEEDITLQPDDIIHLPSNENNKIYVVGAVAEPKYVLYKHGMKVLDVILSAGGFGEYAKQSNILIIRKSGDKLKVDLSALLEGKDLSQNVEVVPGDYVIVKESIF